MSVVVNKIRRGAYLDSVALMRISVAIHALTGVEEAALMMATPANLALMRDAGVLSDPVQRESGAEPGPNDLLIAIRAADVSAAEAAMSQALAQLDSPGSGVLGGAMRSGDGQTPLPRDLQAALVCDPELNLALISVPGEFAVAEAERALDAGLDVMVFSDNVSVAAERALKEKAHALGRLLLGPDCGTAVIAGQPLGFANAVPRGSVGLISASGTGLQELSTLLAHDGVGLSHGIGVGGRDLSAEVGGLAAMAALELLTADETTRQIAVISKPPAPAVAERLLGALAACGKPAVACFLGQPGSPASIGSAGVPVCNRLIDAAEAILGHPVEPLDRLAAEATRGNEAKSGSGASRVVGLFAGGTLCAEAQTVLLEAGCAVESNAPVGAADLAGAAPRDSHHRVLDLGADEFTRGRPHPMLEPAVRASILHDTLVHPGTAVVLLDVVLGYGSHPDPAGAVAAVVSAAREEAAGQGGQASRRPPVPVVASLCGAAGDPQGLAAQRATLEAAGVHVFRATARASEFALSLAGISR